jgi:SAM-dependent methyltransferase
MVTSCTATDMNTSDTSPAPKDRSQFESVMSALCSRISDRQKLSVLVLGGSEDDISSLHTLGFENITLSNLSPLLDPSTFGQADVGIRTVAIDAEDMAVPANAYDLVLAHEVLHHCRSPHRALCEMLRTSRKYIIFMEPNDSLAMRLLVKMRFSFPYELPAVIDHAGKSGGLRDSAVPNFIYRWNRNELSKTVSSYFAEYVFSVQAHPYWDFNIDDKELALRNQTKLSIITNIIGAKHFLKALKFAQKLFNRIPFLRNQGNKFLCLVEKQSELKPWLDFKGNQIVFNPKTLQLILTPTRAYSFLQRFASSEQSGISKIRTCLFW